MIRYHKSFLTYNTVNFQQNGGKRDCPDLEPESFQNFENISELLITIIYIT